jgi:hypothetical protein
MYKCTEQIKASRPQDQTPASLTAEKPSISVLGLLAPQNCSQHSLLAAAGVRTPYYLKYVNSCSSYPGYSVPHMRSQCVK